MKESYISELILNTENEVVLLEGVDIPTVHISLPERVYGELKRIANDMGIQLTDLIKMFIRAGLDGGVIRTNTHTSLVSSTLINKLEHEVSYLKGKIYVMDTIIRELRRRVEELERKIEELESPDILLNTRRQDSRLNKP